MPARQSSVFLPGRGSFFQIARRRTKAVHQTAMLSEFSQRSSEGGDLHAQMGLITMIKRTILAFAISFLLAAGLNSMVSAQEATPDASPIATETSVPTETVAPELPTTGVGTSQDNNSTLLLLGFIAAVGLVGVTGYTAYRRSSR